MPRGQEIYFVLEDKCNYTGAIVIGSCVILLGVSKVRPYQAIPNSVEVGYTAYSVPVFIGGNL